MRSMVLVDLAFAISYTDASHSMIPSHSMIFESGLHQLYILHVCDAGVTQCRTYPALIFMQPAGFLPLLVGLFSLEDWLLYLFSMKYTNRLMNSSPYALDICSQINHGAKYQLEVYPV